jgi:DNA polymerase-3 subunit gamma/tau
MPQPGRLSEPPPADQGPPWDDPAPGEQPGGARSAPGSEQVGQPVQYDRTGRPGGGFAGPSASVRDVGPPSPRSGERARSMADAGLSPAAASGAGDSGGWGSVSSPAPDWATARRSADTRPVGVGATGGPPTTALRGASAVRESFAQARSAIGRRVENDAPSAPLTDDSAVSVDDEDIEVSGDVGRTVIEKVLGGRVVSETAD